MNDGLAGGFPDLTWIWIMLIIAGVGVFGLMIYTQYLESNTIYEMPNGIICKDKLMKGSGMFSSGSTFQFSRCGDGEKYINPEHYEVIKK